MVVFVPGSSEPIVWRAIGKMKMGEASRLFQIQMGSPGATLIDKMDRGRTMLTEGQMRTGDFRALVINLEMSREEWWWKRVLVQVGVPDFASCSLPSCSARVALC